MTVSLRPYLPFEIIYFEQFETEIEAVKREKYFKTSRGREFLKKTLAL
jgi:putative endonuclease